jgi:hypothetical protein
MDTRPSGMENSIPMYFASAVTVVRSEGTSSAAATTAPEGCEPYFRGTVTLEMRDELRVMLAPLASPPLPPEDCVRLGNVRL